MAMLRSLHIVHGKGLGVNLVGKLASCGRCWFSSVVRSLNHDHVSREVCGSVEYQVHQYLWYSIAQHHMGRSGAE